MLKPPSFSHFETLAERLVEGSFQRLFRGRIQLHDLALLLARALEDNQRHNAAANQYQIHLHPETYTTLHDETPDIIAQLSDYLSQLAQQAETMTTKQATALPDRFWHRLLDPFRIYQ